MKYVPPDVLVNPKPKQIEAALAEADRQANPPKAKARNCRFPADLAKKIRNRKEGVYEDDGGAVPNSYKYSAETSHILAAWWTSGNGTRYVRVCKVTTEQVAQIRLRRSQGERLASIAADFSVSFQAISKICCPHHKGKPWAAVFPERNGALLASASKRVQLAMLRCGEWPYWAEGDHLLVEVIRLSRRGDRTKDLLRLATRLLPSISMLPNLRLAAATRVGVIVATDKTTWIVLRQHICEAVVLPPRFGKCNGRTDDEMLNAAVEYLQKKDPSPTDR